MRRFFAFSAFALVAIVFGCVNASAFQILRPSSAVPSAQQVEFSVFLPLQNKAGLDQLLVDLQTPGNPQYHQWLTPAQFRARFGAKQADVDEVTRTLASYGLTVTEVHTQSLRVRGSAQAVQNAFGTQLSNGVAPNGKHGIVASSKLVMPGALESVGAKVVHFSPFIRSRVHSFKGSQVPDNRVGARGLYWFDDLKQAYDFPSYQQLTGAGSTIAIVIGSDINLPDITAYFTHEALAAPMVTTRTVDGGAPFSPESDNSFEAELDVEQAGGMAPGANIVVYNIPDLSDQSIVDGYVAVVDDNVADVVNSSFGGPEALYLPEYNQGADFSFILDIESSIFEQGNAQGITFVCSSGDNGALDTAACRLLLLGAYERESSLETFLPRCRISCSKS